MGSSNLDEDRILASLMQSDDELPCEDTDCEVGDHESEDDVQSDTKESFYRCLRSRQKKILKNL